MNSLLKVLLNLIFLVKTTIESTNYNAILNSCTNSDWWIYQPGSQLCSSSCLFTSIFGGDGAFSINTYLVKTLVLPPHYRITLQGKYWGLDQVSPYNFIYMFDNYQNVAYPFTSYSPYTCPSSSILYYTMSSSQQYLHSSNSITLVLFSYGGTWGIEQLSVQVDECPTGCIACDDSGVCLNYFLFKELDTNPISYVEGWKINGEPSKTLESLTGISTLRVGSFGSESEKEYPIQSYLNIKVTFKIISENGVDYTVRIYANNNLIHARISHGYYYSINCGNSYFYIEYSSPFVQIKSRQLKLKITTELQNPKCLTGGTTYGIRDLIILYTLDDDQYCQDDNIYPFDGCFSQIYSCVEGCKECLNGYCLDCLDGWEYDILTGFCRPFCGDRIIVLNEECDDGNLVQYDGCYNCQISCPLNCMTCHFGLCKLCQSSYYLFEKRCLKQFSDVLLDYEQQSLEGRFNQLQNSIRGNFVQHYALNVKEYLLFKNLFSDCNSKNFNIFGYFSNQCQIPKISNCNQNLINYCLQCEAGFTNTLKQNICIAEQIYTGAEVFKFCDRNIENNPNFHQNCCLGDFNKIFYCGDKIINNNEECDDGNLIPFDGCFNCNFSCPLNCKNCQFGLCKICQNKYQLQGNNCVKYFNDIQLNYYQQTLTGVYNQIQNSIEGNFQYDYVLNTPNFKYNINQLSNCDVNSFQMLGYLQDKCIIQEIPFCNENYVNKCLKCQEGFENSFQQNECLPKCNDLVVEINEQCDDNNNIQFDGCYHCQNNCQIQCLECSNYGCIKCQEGWELIDFQCQQVCSDSKIAIISKEQCDDGNYVQNDGCYNCQYECSKNCSYCDQVECLVCEQYYEINQQNQCQPKCGDGYIIPNVEDCEDGNNIQYDGCYNCKYQCRRNCQDCDQGICLDECDYGYYLIDDECQSKCGDMIVTNREECDDGNNIQFDGCYNCMSSCVDSCVNCVFGRCLQCAKGYIQKGNYCFDVCGNGFKDKLEVCDDGNQVSGDGCSPNCETEDDWECLTVQEFQSYCIQKPQIQLNYLNQTFEIQYVQLSFTKKVILDQTSQLLEESIKCQVNGNDQAAVIKFEPINQLTSDEYKDASYLFTLQFKQSIANKPQFVISFNSIIYDQDDLIIEQKQDYGILLKPVTLLSQNQKELAQQFQDLGNGLIIGLGISSVVILLTGNFLDCFEILNVLQYQAVLRYINVQFPQNLLIYFESSDSISVNPILLKLNIVDFLDYFVGYNYLESIGQFKVYELNSDLINNVYAQFTLVIGFTFALLFIQFYKKAYYKHFFTPRHLHALKYSKSKLLGYGAQIFFQVHQSLFKLEKILTQRGLNQFFLGNSWDLIFKVFLFLASNRNLGLREYISYGLSSIVLIYALAYLSSYFVKQSLKIQIPKLQQLHQPILLIKQILYLTFLIGLQFQPILQGILLTIISTLYLSFIIIFKIISDSLTKFMKILTEGPILIFTLSALAYCTEFEGFINDQNKIYLGFGQIGLLILGLVSQLGKYLYLFCQDVKIKLKSQCKNKKRQIILADHKIFDIYSQ